MTENSTTALIRTTRITATSRRIVPRNEFQVVHEVAPYPQRGTAIDVHEGIVDATWCAVFALDRLAVASLANPVGCPRKVTGGRCVVVLLAFS
ncbi:hypothetical protein [Nocardia sp. NPDC052566]|uniref:hypothetical protein n=1 Tax=Nocardia sp. NPDC052566 TaxID=3364330 RepID=UPI0037C8F0C1